MARAAFATPIEGVKSCVESCVEKQIPPDFNRALFFHALVTQVFTQVFTSDFSKPLICHLPFFHALFSPSFPMGSGSGVALKSTCRPEASDGIALQTPVLRNASEHVISIPPTLRPGGRGMWHFTRTRTGGKMRCARGVMLQGGHAPRGKTVMQCVTTAPATWRHCKNYASLSPKHTFTTYVEILNMYVSSEMCEVCCVFLPQLPDMVSSNITTLDVSIETLHIHVT